VRLFLEASGRPWFGRFGQGSSCKSRRAIGSAAFTNRCEESCLCTQDHTAARITRNDDFRLSRGQSIPRGVWSATIHYSSHHDGRRSIGGKVGGNVVTWLLVANIAFVPAFLHGAKRHGPVRSLSLVQATLLSPRLSQTQIFRRKGALLALCRRGITPRFDVRLITCTVPSQSHGILAIKNTRTICKCQGKKHSGET